MQQTMDNSNKLAVADKLYTPVNGVVITSGLLKDVFDNNLAFLKTLSMDAMLYWFEDKLGNCPVGEPYRGWFEDSLKGQTASMYLMGAGNALRWTEDAELDAGVDTILAKLEESAEEDGFMMPIPKALFGNGEYPHYCRIWLNYGLGAAGLAGKAHAFELLRSWQDWFNTCDALPIIKNLHLSYQGIVASTWVHTLPPGNAEDVAVAQKYYEEDWRLAQFIRRERDAVANRNPQGDEPHAHGTELESFEGYLDLYRAIGATYYLDAVLGAWELYRRDWQHPGGGIVMCEFLDAFPGCGWITPHKPYNEFCCSAFWVGLNQRLHRLFPDDERYASEIEKTIYNVAVANQDGGESIRYFAHLEGQKDPGGKVTCCCGVGTRMYGMLPEYLYSLSDDAVYVDLYAESRLEWQRRSGPVTLHTRTAMPYDGAVEIRIEMIDPTEFTLALRMPGWMSEPAEILVNGVPACTGMPGSYVKLARIWKNGDTVAFQLPMAFRWSRYEGAEQIPGLNQVPAQNFYRYSFEYGPLLYAVAGEIDYNTSIWVRHQPEQVADWALPTDEPLVFDVKGSAQQLVPYFALDENRTFTCFPVFAREHFR